MGYEFSTILIAWLIWAAVFGWFGSWVAHKCGRDGGEGFLLGILFGPLGVIIEALLPRG